MIDVKLKNIELVKQDESFNEYHHTYHIMAGDLKMGEVVHRLSKDTYHVTFDDDFKVLNAEYFRLLSYPFNKEDLEVELTSAFTELVNGLITKLTF